jgi:dethiobiotin synthetase
MGDTRGVRVIVVGTGTEVGKTHVTTCLLAHARRLGRRTSAYKPVATGVDGSCEDAELHAAALGAPYLPPTFAYRRPVSPHLAAREEGHPIDLDVIRQRAGELASNTGDLIIESAGGLFSPLGEATTNVDLVRQLLPAHVLLVAPDRLGVLHDVGACLTAARARGVLVSALVLSAPASPDESTGTNARELQRIGLGPVAAVFPHGPFDDVGSLETAAKLWAALELAHV